jgi:hypothetical protein
MRQSKIIFFSFLVVITFVGCIETFIPKDISNNQPCYVVAGRVTNIGGNQSIKVSKTSPIDLPRHIPVLGCLVSIIDTENNVFLSNSNDNNGTYNVNIDQQYLTISKGFKVKVVTPLGEVIESEFDTLKPCPTLNSVYYEIQERLTENPLVNEKGLQFKIDLIANNSYDRYFKWEIEESFEYTATYPITVYYDGRLHYIEPDYSLFYCWDTKPIWDIFAISTRGLTDNKFTGYNLHFVGNTTQRLMHLYSINVTQIAISEANFNFLEQLRLNTLEQGGLFDAQPINVKGNIFSSSDPALSVFGFFSAESMQSHRSFYSNIPDLDFLLPSVCQPMDLNIALNKFKPKDYPVYFVEIGGELKWPLKSCFDCRLSGGKTEKPPFWP